MPPTRDSRRIGVTQRYAMIRPTLNFDALLPALADVSANSRKSRQHLHSLAVRYCISVILLHLSYHNARAPSVSFRTAEVHYGRLDRSIRFLRHLWLLILAD